MTSRRKFTRARRSWSPGWSPPSWPSWPFGWFAAGRRSARGAALVAVAGVLLAAAAGADPVQVPPAPIPVVPIGPVPLVPALGAPPLPTTPLGRSLAGAFAAIVGIRGADPAAAAQATGLYLQAQQRARAGDVSGALAAASQARAAVLAGFPPTTLVPAGPLATGPTAPGGSAAGVPLANAAATLTPELRAARDAIDRAERAGRGARLDRAKEQYRSGLDAYLSGDAGRAARDARAATAGAEAAVKER